MNKKLIRVFRTNIALYALCFGFFVVSTVRHSPVLAFVEALLAAAVLFIGSRRNAKARRGIRQYFDRVGGGMDSARSSNMLYTPLPMLVFDVNSREILWGKPSVPFLLPLLHRRRWQRLRNWAT